MIVAVNGSREFNDYNIFLRAMAVAMSSIKNDDKEFFIYSAGPANINSFVLEFSNLTERSLKARGIKIKNFKVPPSWILENAEFIDYFAYLTKPNIPLPKIIENAELQNIEVGIFRY